MKVAIVEDDLFFISNLRTFLEGEWEKIELVGAFLSAEEALAKLGECQPEVILVDIGLPGMSGIEFIEECRKILPRVEIMVLTVFEDRDKILAAIRAGASGYLLKSSIRRELVGALFELYQGGAPMTPSIARKIIGELQGSGSASDDEGGLSPREVDILRGIEQGLAYKEISDKFAVSVHTVHAHIRNIYKKLQVSSKKAALQTARRKGLL